MLFLPGKDANFYVQHMCICIRTYLLMSMVACIIPAMHAHRMLVSLRGAFVPPPDFMHPLSCFLTLPSLSLSPCLRWRLEGTLMLHWRPAVAPYTGVTLYELNEQVSFLY